MTKTNQTYQTMIMAICPKCETRALAGCKNCGQSSSWITLNEDYAECKCGEQLESLTCSCGTKVQPEHFKRPTKIQVEVIRRKEKERSDAIVSLVKSGAAGLFGGGIGFAIYHTFIKTVLMTSGNAHNILTANQFFNEGSILWQLLAFASFFWVGSQSIGGVVFAATLGFILSTLVLSIASASVISGLAYVAIPLTGLVVMNLLKRWF